MEDTGGHWEGKTLRSLQPRHKDLCLLHRSLLHWCPLHWSVGWELRAEKVTWRDCGLLA